jgi:pimeloyl-ACP methyl ester carboxylesterase
MKNAFWQAIVPLLLAGILNVAHAAPRSSYLLRYNDVQIDVVAEGSGALIVLLPSLGRAADDYDALAEALAQAGYRVLRPTPRGIGKSTGPAKASLHDYAEDIAQVITHEDKGPAIVLGHAYGNWVARTVAADHPALVRGVVIAAAASRKFDPRLGGYIDKSEDASLPEAERLKYLHMTFFAAASDPRMWLTGWYPQAKALQRNARTATETESFWGAGRAPMLDLMAAEDPFRLPATVNENRLEFGERVSVAVIPNASHALIPEQPAAVAAAVLAWLRTLPASVN